MSVDKSKVLIQVQDLKKAFGSNQVLDGISTDICQGEVVAIIGPSGSGKSTFLRSLNLLEEPTGGKILFEGTDITDPKVDINRHRQKIGMVFQQFNLFPHKTVKLKLREKVGLYIAFVGCMFRFVIIGPKFIMKQFPAFLRHGLVVEARGSQDLP